MKCKIIGFIIRNYEKYLIAAFFGALAKEIKT